MWSQKLGLQQSASYMLFLSNRCSLQWPPILWIQLASRHFKIIKALSLILREKHMLTQHCIVLQQNYPWKSFRDIWSSCESTIWYSITLHSSLPAASSLDSPSRSCVTVLASDQIGRGILAISWVSEGLDCLKLMIHIDDRCSGILWITEFRGFCFFWRLSWLQRLSHDAHRWFSTALSRLLVASVSSMDFRWVRLS